MLLRICLILSILAGLAIIGIAQFKVRPHVQGIIEVRNENERNWKKEEGRARQLTKDLNDTKTTLETTRTRLTEAEQQRDSYKNQFTAEQTRANALVKERDTAKLESRDLKQQLAAWEASGLKVNEVGPLREAKLNLEAENAALKDEKRLLNRKLVQLNNTISNLTSSLEEVPLPAGTKGRVLVVDPKWDFVILDLGEKDSMVPRGVLMIERDGKLVAKVRITSVQKDRSVANIIPGWKLQEPMEGDVVFY